MMQNKKFAGFGATCTAKIHDVDLFKGFSQLSCTSLVTSPFHDHARTGTGDKTNHAPVNHDHQILTPIRGSRYFCTLYGHGIAHVYVTYYGQGISH